MEESREFCRCDPCEGPECVAWDYMACDCCNITGADHVVSREELMALVAMVRSHANEDLDKKTAHAAADNVDGKEAQHDQ